MDDLNGANLWKSHTGDLRIGVFGSNEILT